MDHHKTQASVFTGMVDTGMDPTPSPVDSGARCTYGNGQTSVLVDLLRQVRKAQKKLCVSLSGWKK